MTATYLVFDTETTGLFDFKLPADDPSQPRLASAAFIIHRRGKKSRRIRASAFPFEHGTLMAAISEIEKLTGGGE